MDRLTEVRDEIRRGNLTSAEAILDDVLARQQEITSHLLFDLTSAYEELFTATDRYEDLIRKSRDCADRARPLPEVDRKIHAAHTLIVSAFAENALGRNSDAARNADNAERLLISLPAGRFRGSSRERMNKLQVRLRSLKNALADDVHRQSSQTQASGSTSAQPLDWCNFVSQRDLSSKGVRAALNKMHRLAGPVASLAVLLDWATAAPRGSGIGRHADCFVMLVEELAAITSAHALSVDTQRKLYKVLFDWEHVHDSWLQRLINGNRKSGLRHELQRLRCALEAKTQHTLNSVDVQLTELESSDRSMVLDETHSQNRQPKLLLLESELDQLATFVPAPASLRFNLLRKRLASIKARIDSELRLGEEAYTKLLEEVANAASRSALSDLRIVIRQQFPAAVQMRSQLQLALEQAEDRLLAAQLKSLEREERATHLAKLDSVRGVNLANLLFREYGVDLPAARKLVIDRNNGVIDLDSLLDSVIKSARTKQGDPAKLPEK